MSRGFHFQHEFKLIRISLSLYFLLHSCRGHAKQLDDLVECVFGESTEQLGYRLLRKQLIRTSEK